MKSVKEVERYDATGHRDEAYERVRDTPFLTVTGTNEMHLSMKKYQAKRFIRHVNRALKNPGTRTPQMHGNTKINITIQEE